MIAAIALFALAQLQTVTFTHPAAHSSVVLAALGEELGMTIKPSGSVNKDYFLVRFDDVPVNDALDKIAETLNATWSEKSGVRYLGRTHAQELEDERRDAEPFLREHGKYFKSAIVPPDFTIDLARAMLPAPGRQTVERGVTVIEQPKNVPLLPGKRALDKLVRSLQKGTLLSIKDQRRHVLRSREVPAWRDAFRGLTLECNTLASLAKATYDQAGQTTGAVNAWSKRTSPVTAMELQVSRQGPGASYSLIYGGEGWSTTDTLRIPNNRYSRMHEEPVWGDMADPFEFGEDGKMILDYLIAKRESEGKEPLHPPAPLVEYMLDLESNGLLGPLIGDAWLELLRTKGMNGVVVLPDSALGVALRRPDLQTSVSVILGYGAQGMDVVITGRTLTAVPSAPSAARANRFDRKATQRYIRAVLRKKRVLVDDAAAFAAGQENRRALVSADRVAKVVMPMDADRWFNAFGASSRALAVYGLLDAAQKKAAWDGGATVEIRSARKKLADLLGEIFLSGDMRLAKEYKPVDDWGYRAQTPGGAYVGLAVGGLIPRDARVRVTVVREMKLSPMQPIETRTLIAARPASIEEFVMWAKRGKLPGFPNLDYTKALWHQMARVEVSLHMPGQGYATVSTIVDERLFDDKHVELNKLPAAVQRELAAAGMKVGKEQR
ncbi:MAG: hypothetical protein IH944_10700 [Armatimonadetes bacterium]|nr:hypothetical protein [Armatimonadota bacterium]